ncbi:MAG: 3-phosphoshikimate 1-carboxyvinyltransferase [Candidatus Caldatribacteriaceae bacterium]
MSTAIIHPYQGVLKGVIPCPRDKSLSHRAVMIGALSQGTTIITGFSFCQDCLATVRCMQALGASIQTFPEKGEVIVESEGLFALREPDDVLNAENSGTTIRMLAGITAGIEGLTIITGDQSLRRRPMRRVIEPLRQTGATLGGRAGDSFPPLFIKGIPRTKSFQHTLKVPSAQVKSALIFAALKGDGPSFIEEPVASRDHTENMLRYVGASIRKDHTTIIVEPCLKLQAKAFSLPGDVSSAAFLVALATLLPGSSITIEDVGINPQRTGFLRCLATMGGKWQFFNQREEFGEPRGDLKVEAARLQGIEITRDSIPSLIDEIPILAVLASQAEGKTIISGAEELRVKESDRLRAIAQGLQSLGAQVEEKDDGLIIEGPTPLRGGRIQSFGDHRIAMSFAIAGFVAQKDVVIEDVDCISISYPHFFQDLATLGCDSFRLQNA